MIELTNVTKLYGTVIGVNDINLSLGPGVYGLLGPNGSGKTTLLNLTTGQLKPTQGSIRVYGRAPWNNNELFRRLGVCPAQDMLYANVTALEWVRNMLRLLGYNAQAAGRLAEQTLERVGMGKSMRRPMGTYSKGMRQRTKLAQAVAHEPDLLILDEPFNGLDPIGRHEMTELLRDWIKERSLILASHILFEVEAISTSFLLILGGRLLASGLADEVQFLLAGVPCEIHIYCDRPHELGQLLLAEQAAESVRIEGAGLLTVATKNPTRLAQEMPGWVETRGLVIHEIHAPDDSLQSLFNSLIRLHRGELA